MKVKTLKLNFSSPTFHRYAMEYYECKRDFNSQRHFSPVPYVLLCRAIELELKSRYLKNATQSSVRKYSHMLRRLYVDLPKKQKILSLAEFGVLASADAIYNEEKGFEYIKPYDASLGFSRFPALKDLDKVARKLIRDGDNWVV